jgi:hypothetical protein
MSFSSYGAFPAAPTLQWPDDGPLQQPGDFLDYSYVAYHETDLGTDPIVSAELAVKPSGSGEMTPSDLTVSGTTVTVWMAGGVAGRRYVVRLTLVTASGRIFDVPIGMLVDPTLAVLPLPTAPSNDFGTVITWPGGGGDGFAMVGRTALVGLTADGSSVTVPAQATIIAASFVNPSGQPVTVSLGTTSGAADVLPPTLVPAGNCVPVGLSGLLDAQSMQPLPLFVSSTAWGAASINVVVFYVL